MTDNAFDPDDPDHSEVMRLIREAIAKRRGYADFFDWPPAPRLAERGVAQHVCNFLVNRGDIQAGQVSLVDKDPPDVLCVTGDGLRIGIEVTELVNSEVVARARFLKEQGQEFIGLLANWTSDTIAQELADRIRVKDGKLARAHGAYDKLLLAVYTDEPMIDEALARPAVAKRTFSAESISSAFFVLSYHPRADKTVFPDGYPILPISITRTDK